MSNLTRRLGAQRGKASAAATMPFAQWLPDRPDLSNPGMLEANNVIPADNYYLPVKAPVQLSVNQLDNRVLGALAVVDKDENSYTYAGTVNKLWEMRGNEFFDESRGAGYSTAAEGFWKFAPWDVRQKMMATNFTDPVQSITIGAGGSEDFVDMITSTAKPRAKHIAVVGNHAVLGNIFESSEGDMPSGIWWSAFNDETDFQPNATTQSDFDRMTTGGPIQGVIGGAEYGVIYQSNLVRRMERTSPPVVFAFPAVDRSRGTPIPTSIVAFGRYIYSIAEEGFMRFDGSQQVPIGTEKVDRYFWGQFDINNKLGVSAAIDRVNKLVCWAFPGSGTGGDLPNKILFYRWDLDRWSQAEVDTEIILSALSQGGTVDNLPIPNIDDPSVSGISVDSSQWKGGSQFLGSFDRQRGLCSFSGFNLGATLVTPEVEINLGMRTILQSMRALIDTTQVNIRLASRDRQDQFAVYGNPQSANSIGEFNFRDEARYHRAAVTIDSGVVWTKAYGLQAYAIPGGRR